MAVRVLVVDDQSHHRDSIKYQLDKAGYKVTKAQSGAEALTAFENNEFDVALIDYKMANMDGMELLKRVHARWPQVAVILMTGYANIPVAVEAIKNGAAEFLEKPFKPGDLIEKLKKVLAENDRSGVSSPGRGAPFDDMVGRSPAIVQAIELGRTASTTDKPVLLIGEYGTGREMVARAIHGSGGRRDRAFVPVRCGGAGPELDIELFGNPNGAPVGKLIEGNGGTVYLEEVSDLPIESQAKLLRYLQDGEVSRGPTSPPAHSDARIVASTSKPIEDLVAAGKVRQELALRLRGITIRLPPLRERLGDLPLLVQQITRRHKARGSQPAKFDKEALGILASLKYEGNLRELEDIVTQAIALARDGEVTRDTLAALGLQVPQSEAIDTDMKSQLEHEEKRVIMDELKRNPHNLKQVARNLNISRTTLWRKMRRYGIEGA